MLMIIQSPYIMKKMEKTYTGWLSLLFLYQLCIPHTDAMKIKLLGNTKRMYTYRKHKQGCTLRYKINGGEKMNTRDVKYRGFVVNSYL